MKLVEMLSAEADFRAFSEPAIALIPIGAVEQHSRHLPLGTDALIVDMISHEVEARARNHVVLLPTVYVGASDHHLAMPGTVSVGSLAIAESLANQCRSLHRSSGIEAFFILNGHGGNQPAARLTLELLGHSDAPLTGFAADYWALMFDEIPSVDDAYPRSMGHADLIETSILLAKRPDLVRMDLAQPDEYVDNLPSGMYTTRGIPERTRFGGVGDPVAATAKLGDRLFEAAVEGAMRAFDRAAALLRSSA